MEKYICEYCGKEFEHETKISKHVFCSRTCSEKYHVGNKHPKSKGAIFKNCKYCNNQFEVPINSTRQFCSRKCFYAQHSIDETGEKHPRYKGKIKKNCKYCGKEFEVYAKAKRGVTFCSHKCGALWWGENHRGKKNANWTPKVKKTCLNCGKIYEIIPSVDKRGRGKFCSKACSNEWQSKNAPSGANHPNWKQKVKKQCKYCGKEFERLESDKWGITFCSRSCFNKWYSENKSGKNSHRWKQITQTCIECGKAFTTYPARVQKQSRGKFCSKKCMAVWQSKNICGENHPSWIDGRSFLPYCSKFNNKLKEMVRRRDNHVCQLCGLSEKENGKKLDVHHIHYDKENCYPDLTALCCKCNTFVNKLIKRSYYEQFFMNTLNDRGLLFWTVYVTK